jgi:hypothetical protein
MISVISALHECSAQESSSSKGVQEEKELEPKLNKELKDIIKEPIYDERHLMLRQLSIKIAVSNPESAWKLSKKIPFVPDRIAFSVPLMRLWGREDPLKALERSRDLPDGELRLMVANSALEGWAEKAPLEALQSLSFLPQNSLRSDWGSLGAQWWWC